MKFLFLALIFVVACKACVYYKTGVTSTEKTSIVKIHNDLRIQIAIGNVTDQPRGINLKYFYWDDSLASAAQNISDSCVFAHQKVTDDRWSVGQNLYSSWSTANKQAAVWSTAINAWFNEYPSYTYGGSFKGVGHYTQIVWANTQNIGCGYTYYKPTANSSGYTKFYVCNYGPAGNIVGQLPYEIGDSGCEDLC